MDGAGQQIQHMSVRQKLSLEEIARLCAYHICAVRSQTWSIVYGTVCSDKGTELCKRTSSVSLTIRSDDNTVIYTEGQPIDEASNVLQLSTEQVSDMLTIDAVTIDSDKQKDKPCQVTMTCKTTVDGIGELQVTATADYLGNT